MKYSTVLLASLFSPNKTVNAGVVFGSCPENVNIVENFRKERYVGKWYENVRDWSTNFEWWGECTTAIYTPKDAGAKIGVANRAWFWWTGFDYYQVDGSAKCNDDAGVGGCYVNFTFTGTEGAYEWTEDL